MFKLVGVAFQNFQEAAQQKANQNLSRLNAQIEAEQGGHGKSLPLQLQGHGAGKTQAMEQTQSKDDKDFGL